MANSPKPKRSFLQGRARVHNQRAEPTPQARAPGLKGDGEGFPTAATALPDSAQDWGTGPASKVGRGRMKEQELVVLFIAARVDLAVHA